jgi:hypothetical protein
MVLRGSKALYSEPLNLSSKDNEGLLLKAISTGVYPSFSLCYQVPDRLMDSYADRFYGSLFSANKDAVIKAASLTAGYYRAVGNAGIKRFEQLDANFRRTVFDNGVTVTVNFGEQDAVIDGVTVKAKSYSYTTLSGIEASRR